MARLVEHAGLGEQRVDALRVEALEGLRPFGRITEHVEQVGLGLLHLLLGEHVLDDAVALGLHGFHDALDRGLLGVEARRYRITPAPLRETRCTRR